MDEDSFLSQILQIMGDVPSTTIPFIKCAGQRAGWLNLIAAAAGCVGCECPAPMIALLSQTGKDGKQHGGFCATYAAAAASADKGGLWGQIASWALTGGVVNTADPLGPTVPGGGSKSSSKCSGCRPSQSSQPINKGGSLWKGTPLWPGLKVKGSSGDEGNLLYRPTMIDGVYAPAVTYDGADTPGAPLPEPGVTQLAPYWSKAAFAAAAKGLRPTLIAVEATADQPDANLKYFWAAVAKWAPESASYYIAQGVPVPDDLQANVKSAIQAGAGMDSTQLLLLAALGYWLIKG